MLVGVSLLATSGGGSAATGWKDVQVTRQQGQIAATLSYSYEVRPSGPGWFGRLMPTYTYRDVRLVVRWAGAAVINDLWDGNPFKRRFTLTIPAGFALTLRDVWRSGQPEALVTMWTGGNRCCDLLEVGLVTGVRRGRVLFQSFPMVSGVPQGSWHDGTYDFVSEDLRFMCAFTACAGSSDPIEIFAIDKAGRHFADVTRSRPDLVEADAAGQWRTYVSAGRGAIGLLAPWCADEYLLGRKGRCDGVLDHALAKGWLNSFYDIVSNKHGGQAFVSALHKALTAWGYG